MTMIVNPSRKSAATILWLGLLFGDNPVMTL